MPARTIQAYYQLAKPGIVYGNSITAVGGYMLAANGHVAPRTLAAAIIGLALIMASACVYNNYIDRDIDKIMSRTKKRALACGNIPGRNALVYAMLLALAGSVILALWTNGLALGTALFGLFAYVVIYGIGKRRTVHGTLIGSVSGAVPPVVGYSAVSGSFNLGALLVFMVLVCWQMPHFYAIAMYRHPDYAAADIPVLPVVKGMRAAKLHIVTFIVLFILASSALTIAGYTGFVYMAGVLTVGLYWLYKGIAGLHTPDDAAWARQMFGYSLIVLLVWSGMVSIDSFLP